MAQHMQKQVLHTTATEWRTKIIIIWIDVEKLSDEIQYKLLIKNGKDKVKLLLFEDDMIRYIYKARKISPKSF